MHLALTPFLRAIDMVVVAGMLPVPLGLAALLWYVRYRPPWINLIGLYLLSCAVWLFVWVAPDKALERQGLRGAYLLVGAAIPLVGVAAAVFIVRRHQRRDRIGFPVYLPDDAGGKKRE